MARTAETFEIKGWTYSVVPMGARKGRKLSIEFVRLLSSLIASLPEDLNFDLDAELSWEAVRPYLSVLMAALDKIDPEKLEPFWAAYCENALAKSGKTTMVLGDEEKFDEHFTCSYLEMWEFFVRASLINFGGFLGPLGAEKDPAEKP